MDSDVIKQYVSLGMGVGIVASMAFDHGRDRGLRAIESSHLFAPNVTRLAVRRGAYLRAYAYDFIERFAQGFTRRGYREGAASGAWWSDRRLRLRRRPRAAAIHWTKRQFAPPVSGGRIGPLADRHGHP